MGPNDKQKERAKRNKLIAEGKYKPAIMYKKKKK